MLQPKDMEYKGSMGEISFLIRIKQCNEKTSVQLNPDQTEIFEKKKDLELVFVRKNTLFFGKWVYSLFEE